MRYAKLMLCAASLGMSASALAADIRAGMWEIRLEPSVTGMPMQMPAQTMQQCMKKDAPVPQSQQNMPEGCDMKSNVSGAQVSWTVNCKNPQGELKGRGSVRYNGDQFTGESFMDMQGMTITTRMSGRRIGDC